MNRAAAVQFACGFTIWLAVHTCCAIEVEALRRPIEVQMLSSASHVATANRSGTVSVVDAVRGAVIRESKVGTQLSDLVPIPRHNDCFLATDEAAHQLIAVRITEGKTE